MFVDNNIHLSIQTRYIPMESSPSENQYVFGYVVTIINSGTTAYTLVKRYWKITDAEGGVREVEGIGVVGQQPCIPPGASFTYDSHAVLPTEAGSMEGHYQFLDEEGDFMVLPIPPFLLANPECVH